MTPHARPFVIAVPDAKLSEIRARLAAAQISCVPDDDADWRYGTDARYLREFIDYWLARYDWRTWEKTLNAVPQFKATVDGIDIHFQHIKGSGARPLPLILTHGWPGSFFEFYKTADRLAHPERYGGKAEDGFDLVIPSLPGYGFSGGPPHPIGPRRVAALWLKLMTEVLGYQRFGIQGGDWGSPVSCWLAFDGAAHTVGVHVNILMAAPGNPPDDAERDWLKRLEAARSKESAYQLLQMTKPQTIGIALSDTPAGFAAWVLEKFYTWADSRGNIERQFTKDELITNLMIYLVNDAVTSSIWLYNGLAQELAGGAHVGRKITVPVGCALFPAEFLPWPPRHTLEREYNIVHWSEMKAGGHFAALEEPEAFADDVRAFFAPLREK